MTIDARADPGGRALIEGCAAMPALPKRRIRLHADASHMSVEGPELPALVRYVADSLRRDVVEELPVN